MGKLIDAIIRKWFCCHDWELIKEEEVTNTTTTNDLLKGNSRIESTYIRLHYICRKCGKYMVIDKGRKIK